MRKENKEVLVRCQYEHHCKYYEGEYSTVKCVRCDNNQCKEKRK